jgi:hypothetical protein
VSVSYQLRPQYVGVYGGGQINVGNAGYVFDVGAALTAGGGTIVAADADLANALDRYAPLFRSSETSDPLVPVMQDRLRNLSVGNAAAAGEAVFESRLNNEAYPRFRLLANGTITTGPGSAAPTSRAGGTFAVETFGARSDAVSDDTAAVQAAIDAANAAGGGVVQLPAGTTLCTSGLTMRSYVTLRGQGQFATVLKITGAANGALIYGSDATHPASSGSRSPAPGSPRPPRAGYGCCTASSATCRTSRSSMCGSPTSPATPSTSRTRSSACSRIAGSSTRPGTGSTSPSARRSRSSPATSAPPPRAATTSTPPPTAR